jgi:glycosyltransferase involved in cell wall biosynthesis
MRRLGAGVFHGTNFEVPYLTPVPSILTLHDLSPWRDRSWHEAANRVRQRTPWLIRLGRADLILTVSESVRKEAISFFHLAPERVRTVPLAASELFRPVAAEGAKRPYFLFVGTLEPRKNISGLIEAWRATRAETGADLFIAGRTRPDFVPPAPFEGLSYLGEVRDEDLPGLYSGALAFIYPTLYEGFGLPVLEAMQCGCPVIASDDPAVTEVSGGAAIHAPNPGTLAQALRGVAENRDLRDRMRQAGLSRARAFSWRKTARQTRALYAELAGVSG